MRARLRPMLRVETIVLVVIAWLIATVNNAWWSAVGAGRAWGDVTNWLFIVAVFVALVALHFVLLGAVANRWTVRPLLTVIVIASAATLYFMRTYAVIMDPTMIRNILETDMREARELMSWSLAGFVLAWSALPVAFVWWVRIEHRPWVRAFFLRTGYMAGALLVAVLSVLLISRDFTSLMRNQREMRYLITPGNYIYGLVGNLARGARDARAVREPVGTDARVIRVAMATHKPRVFVLVVGETVRAANFSLLGNYARATTPELAKLDVLAFRSVTSCGTSTEVSVPCMFSPWGREDYDERRIRNSEGLLDVLARAGYAVKWLDNQSGCKGVCQGGGIEYQKIASDSAPDLCTADECLDGVLVRRLQSELAGARGDSVFVLHMMGNHGPAYYRRYPPEFRRFMPDCATAELRNCTREQVVNAYDNAILYADHVLAGVVGSLANSPQFDTAMIYVSDHGESLGENGLYLHGLPYSIAPDTQTHVPMIAWLSPGFSAATALSRPCVLAKSDDELSHDNLFHSVLGLLDVRTQVYNPGRDIFEGCRGRAGPAFAQTSAVGR
ncbi:MAG TPA: phosphoethanolamine--lipid A transferase [Steroidobacteraceae bacterium]|nr:phosphoethanolamine--lipid A transferase [Steroidobacteraceae bacterium]